jgi:DNA replication protein DnaC
MTRLVYERVHDHLRRLKLATVDEVLDNALNAASAGGKSFLDLLDELLGEEVRVRRQASIATRTRLSAMPTRKSLDDFDYAFQPSIDKRVVEELRTLRFVHNAENVVLLGPPGVGKTHIALGLGQEVIQAGFMVYYSSMSTLLERLKAAQRRDALEAKLRVYVKPRLLILDEMGYQPVDREGSSLFFELVTRRYERGSTIFTSNKSFGDWGELFGDAVVASALLDRILHHATVINIKGDSYRMKSRRRTGSPVQNPLTQTQGVDAKG